MQLGKLAVIGNSCFWLTLLFQYYKPARNLQQDLLHTIVMIGLSSIVVNVTWLVSSIIKKLIIDKDHNQVKKDNQYTGLLLSYFNIFSFAAQLIFLYSKFL